ncbi:TonB-dependent receptor [Parvularcula maris]|uniref:TonB-dependent receptor n=1 Tax=Parvularcula maris TaxID=2965077 RepID=A0A9X2RHC4_9PROT|nr:TonB-dependent receptor [Parvularcula maris]
MKQGTNIRGLKTSLALFTSLSALAVTAPAFAQDVEAEEGNSADTALADDVIIVRGIRKALAASSDIKRDGQGVVDAITAEDIGEFPDTNLAESLQRISGVSIDRRNGEGSTVTVRGFGPQYNLVLLNGRQMPTAFLEGGAPSSRSFDFADLASEGIAGVRVYKTGRAALPTGGIGSTLNILTARPLDAPGMKLSLGAKAVIDDSITELDGGDPAVTPEFSGFYSNTFLEDKVGVAITGAYQKRESGFAQFGTTSGWRGAYLGSDNNWGTLPRDGRAENRPGDNDVYAVPQNANYSLVGIERERINGQVSLQYRPIDTLTTTLDYFYSRNEIDTRTSDLSVWFNHGNTTSAWGDGPISDILFYNEDFGDAGTDLSMGTARTGTLSEKNSVGFNAEWEATENLSVVFDIHSSSAESGSNSPFGTSGVVSTADFSLRRQDLDFRTEIPTLALGFQDGSSNIAAARMLGTGSTFQDSFIRTEIDQAQIVATYAFDESIVRSIDFGLTATKNDFQSTFSNNQRDSWGGVGSPDDYPDDIWERTNLASNFDQFGGYQGIPGEFFVVDFERLISIMDQSIGTFGPICGGDGNCINDVPVATDRRTEEESYSAFIEIDTEFMIGSMPASIIAGVRYEQTDVTSEALVPIPTGTQWVAANEFGLLGVNDPENRDFTQLEGDYDFWLPAIDFQVNPHDDVVLRASYSKTMTRPSYADIQGGQTVAQLFRIDGGDGSAGNPALEPFLSTNLDFSAEYYYNDASYISVGYFWKEVENFNGVETIFDTPFDIYTPVGGARWNAAVAALGSDEDLVAIRQWIFDNADPNTFEVTGTDVAGNTTGNIFGVAGEDPLLQFQINRPINDEETRSVDGWEFAWQHVFGETGFGFIANYTIVDGDVTFDPNQPGAASAGSGEQVFALTGLSDSYNLVGFYDKDGIQARLAYNWRDEFLASTFGVNGEANNPLFVEAYGQLDFSASYDVTDKLTAYVEGINVLNETRTVVGNSAAYVNFATQNGPRYNVGVRYTF